jgi:hypothetical protein
MNFRRAESVLIRMLLMLGPTVCACSPCTATEEEIDSMCRHLHELSTIRSGEPVLKPIATDLEKCKANPLMAATVAEMVPCRLAAKDVYSFWNCYR